MGQSQSAAPRAPRTHEELVKELANRFAQKCFTPLELYCLKDNFRSLADATEVGPAVIRGAAAAGGSPDEAGSDGNESPPGEEPAGEEDGASPPPQPQPRRQVVRYLKEDTVARFLAVPDILGASPVVFQMLSYLGAFPFLSEAPAVLGLEQLVIVVTLLTDRYRRVLARGARDRQTLLFRSLAVHDRVLFGGEGGEKTKKAPVPAGDNDATGGTAPAPAAAGTSAGFAVDAAVEDEDGEEDGEGDALVLAAFEALDYVDVPADDATSKKGTEAMATAAAALRGVRIPADNFRKLLMLLLLAAPLGPQEPLSLYADRFTGAALDRLRATAQCVLATFLDVETSPGITFAHFDALVPACVPFLFAGLDTLFERFTFSKNLDLSRTKPGIGGGGGGGGDSGGSGGGGAKQEEPPAPPLLVRDADDTILDLHLLAQLSFFLPGASLFHRLRLLYSGSNDGFSMGSFETRVFNWRAPTILLVKGTRVREASRGGGPAAAFAAALPPRRFPDGRRRSPANSRDDADNDDDDDDDLIFGAYVSQPWRLTNRECFGDSDVVLFQLSPVHDVFGASALNRDYVAFVKPSAANQHAGGIGFGCPPPAGTAAQASRRQHQAAASPEGVLPLGPLSLMIDANLEYGVLTHDRGHDSHGGGGGGGGGGAFRTSAARAFSFQERFSIEALEVWGCGGDSEAQAQAERWAWEAREAEARRRINLGTGDIEADRALLEMAGLIGGNRSGGSMM